jgi:hypothetical protein
MCTVSGFSITQHVVYYVQKLGSAFLIIFSGRALKRLVTFSLYGWQSICIRCIRFYSTKCTMLFHSRREPDPERIAEEALLLDFEYPSWIRTHHRHNLIKKIDRPKASVGILDCLWSKISEGKRETHSIHNHEDHLPRNEQGQQIQKGNKRQEGQDKQPHMGQPIQECPEEIRESYRINLAELQVMHLRQLQHKLIKHVVDLRYNALEPSGWAEDLKQYGEHNTSLPKSHFSLSCYIGGLCSPQSSYRPVDSTSPTRLRLHGAIPPDTQGSILYYW